MASTSTSPTRSDSRTLPKPGPNSVITRRLSFSEEQQQRLMTRQAVNEYIARTFGGGQTEAEKAFVAALNENGKFSLRLVLLYVFVIWYMNAVVLVTSHLPLENQSFSIRCQIPALEDCLNFTQVLDISLKNKTPTIEDGISTQYCRYDDRQYQQLAAIYSCEYEAMLHAIKLETSTPLTKPCENFVIIRENVSTILPGTLSTSQSIREKFTLFCDDDFWIRVFRLARWYGIILSHLIVGLAADMFGRKFVFVIASLVNLLSYILLILPFKWTMALGFAISGFGRGAAFTIYILFLEECSDVTVLWMGLLIMLLKPLAYFSSFVLRYTISSWMYLHLASASMLLVLPFGIWYIIESPRWLMFTGNTAGAWKALKELGSTAEPSSSDVDTPVTSKQTLTKIFKFFKEPLYRGRIAVCLILYFLTAISFYIRERETMKDMHVGTQEYYLIAISFQVLVLASVYFSAIKFGRKKTAFVFYCTLTCFDLLIFMENRLFNSKQALPIMLYFRSSVNQSVSYMLIFYISEMFPTAYRVTALNMCLISMRFSHLLQNYFYEAFNPESKSVMYMPQFIATTICALVIWFLPETKGKGLPDTPRDALHLKLLNDVDT